MVLPLIGPIIAGLGSILGGGAAAGAGSAGLGTMLAGAAKTLAPMAIQAGLGYALGGPSGALQVPLMGRMMQSRGVNPTQGLMMPILAGLGGRALGGPAGGLMGYGLGSLLDPKFGPMRGTEKITEPAGDPKTVPSPMGPADFLKPWQSPTAFGAAPLMIKQISRIK